MQTNLIIYPILSLGLMVGGVMLIVYVARVAKRLIASRVDMISPATAGAGVGAGVGASGFHDAGALVKDVKPGSAAAQVAEIARLCRQLKIDPRNAAAILTAVRIAFAAVLAAVAFTLLHHVLPARAAAAVGLLGAAVFALVGWLAPAMIVAARAKRRSADVVEGFPEALELMVVCVEAGLALEESIDRVARELKLSQPTLATELELTSADLKILPDRDQALRNMAERTGAPSVRSVMTTLSQTLRYGTPLAQALRTAAAELRNDSLLNLEERANRLPTLLTLPMVLFIMPTIFLIVGGPALIRLLDSFAK